MAERWRSVGVHGSPGAGRSIGIVGGTGALGRGLALRLAMAGLDVRIGSRDTQRAEDRASALQERLRDRPGAGVVTGGTNRATVASERMIVLAVPVEGLDATLDELAELVEGSTVICAVNPLGFDDAGPFLVDVGASSVAESVAARLPGARVVAAFHTVSSHELAALDRAMDDDVPVVGDDADACAEVAALVGRIDGCRGVPAGPLRLAVGLEALTPLLIAVNRRASAHVGVRFSRLPEPGSAGGG